MATTKDTIPVGKASARNRLLINSNGKWIFSENFLTYGAAVRAGQERAPRSFTIDTGNRTPTREEQLLIAPRAAKRAAVMDLL